MALPCWVTAPTPAATDGERLRNSSSWLLAIAAAAHPACPAWNRAWRLACDVGPPLAAYGPQCDNGALSPQDASVCDAFYAPLLLPQPPPPAPAPLVYVPTLCLPAFAQHVLPRVPAASRLVLVSGLADWGPARVFGRGSEPAGRAACEALLRDARVLAWWAEMLDFGLQEGGGVAGKGPHALPLGVDLHTLAFKPSERPAWGPPQAPLRQAAALWAAAAAARHADPRVYVCWGIRNRRRLAVSEAAAAHPSVYAADPSAPGTLLRTDFWARTGAHEWCACVQGYGRDCHRTWEVLALGGGVVVEDMPFTRRALEGLPAVFLGSGAGEEGGSSGGSSGAGGGVGGSERSGAAGGGSAAAAATAARAPQPPPRGTFSRPWQELGAVLPRLAQARVQARGSGACCPGLARLAAAAGGSGSGSSDSSSGGSSGGAETRAPAALLGALAQALVAGAEGQAEAAAEAGAPPLQPPAGVHALLLARPWLEAMRRSAHRA
jgi:hypothetical protein